jgi:hypothetical protein
MVDDHYLYRLSSKWNLKKKRVQPKTGEYLRRTAPDGPFEPKSMGIMKLHD